MKKIPRSPFATRLSGSAREIELRIRSIFQWKKQRPPLALFLLMLVIGLLCGNLVSCQSPFLRPLFPLLPGHRHGGPGGAGGRNAL